MSIIISVTPPTTVNEVRGLTGATYPAANQLVECLVKIGILAEIAGKAGNHRFRYNAYVLLFDELDANPPGAAA